MSLFKSLKLQLQNPNMITGKCFQIVNILCNVYVGIWYFNKRDIKDTLIFHKNWLCLCSVELYFRSDLHICYHVGNAISNNLLSKRANRFVTANQLSIVRLGFSTSVSSILQTLCAIIKEFSVTTLGSMKGLHIQLHKNGICNDKEIQDKNTDSIIKHLVCLLITFNSLVMAQMSHSLLQTS